MYPPPGQPGFPQQPWNPQGAPPGNWGAPPPPPRSSALKWVGLGCGALLVLTCVGGGIAAFLLKKGITALGPGREIGTQFVTPGMPFVLTYVQANNQETRVWLDLDVSYTQGVQLTGPLAVRSNGTPIAQYNLGLTQGPCTSHVRESRSSFCSNWNYSQMNGTGSLSGQSRLFVIPAQPQGATVTVSGMVFSTPGIQVRRLRLFASE